MRVRTSAFAGALVLASALAPSADATPGGDSPHGGCGFLVVNTDPSNPQSAHFEGAMDVQAYWTSDSPGAPTTTSSSVDCTLQTSANYGGGGVLSSCTFSGPLSVLVVGGCVVSIDVSPSQAVFLCTSFHWTDWTGYHWIDVDYDPVTVGSQCSLATST